ncbi:SpoIIIAH-like family protein [Domibacillus sp. PGB-M46]|uniref:SpoIIIAH-like family protein n=1 Tax=Domibacillus sp. PGB-M46 TaxID=2910255 RepID=UPI001F5A3F5C|nr:SpoIIIAH-like family protein [Domibacillus sp. PGB-M46]MCI2254586.1 SpoIIIAH-like family protein [Domibacillus sp. PGB-M46]
MPKKQTVWLFTMVSLTAVLGVYYMTGPEKLLPASTLEEKVSEPEKEVDVAVEETPTDEVFEMIRLEAEEERSRLKEELTAKVASADLSAEAKDEAYTTIQELDEQAASERMLETVIKSKGYEDALVRTMDGEVRVTVKADSHSTEAANELIRLAKEEMGDKMPVSVEFEPLK